MIVILSNSPSRGILKHGLGSPSWRLSDTVSGRYAKVSGKRKRIAKLAPTKVGQALQAVKNKELELERELALLERRENFIRAHAVKPESYL